MVEVSLGLLWGMGTVWVALIWWRLERNALILKHELAEAARAVEAASPTNFNITDLKAELEDLIADTIGSMQPPSIADHLGGVLAQWAQIKMMKEAQGMGPAQLEPHMES
jgi:NTP pyrophosphatase (non-canonical NTP hydrolase)